MISWSWAGLRDHSIATPCSVPQWACSLLRALRSRLVLGPPCTQLTRFSGACKPSGVCRLVNSAVPLHDCSTNACNMYPNVLTNNMFKRTATDQACNRVPTSGSKLSKLWHHCASTLQHRLLLHPTCMSRSCAGGMKAKSARSQSTLSRRFSCIPASARSFVAYLLRPLCMTADSPPCYPVACVTHFCVSEQTAQGCVRLCVPARCSCAMLTCSSTPNAHRVMQHPAAAHPSPHRATTVST